MNESITIQKKPVLPEGEDYYFLREEGIKHLQSLSGNIWTDYNIHDPGINILEVLCYVFSDLGYRTSYSIKDLLAENTGKEIKWDEQFFTAREILTCNPVTFNDYRKLMIDVKGVKNAWLSIVEKSEPPLYLNCKESKLQYIEEDESENINLGGLYDITLELDKDPELGDLNNFVFEIPVKKGSESFTLFIILPSWAEYINDSIYSDEIIKFWFTNITNISAKEYKAKLKTKLTDGSLLEEDITFRSSAKHTAARFDLIKDILQDISDESLSKHYYDLISASLPIGEKVKEILHSHRNLCEDFNKFKPLEIEHIAVCADIEVEPGADMEAVLAKVYYYLEKHIAPQVNFYTLEEEFSKGKKSDEIFNGPKLNHGFIEEEELEASEPKEEILVSDLIQIIMDIEGVLAVKKIILASYYNGEIINDKVEWCLKIGEDHVPRLNIGKSKIVFYKENLPYYAQKNRTEELLEELYALERNPKLSSDETYDIPIEKGVSKSPAEYTSLQNHFPLTYGIGEAGIPGKVTNQRRAKARQLKAYLMFFDQLLANYLSQLAHVKELFSFSYKIDRTYFYQVLYNLPEGFSFPAGDKGSDITYVPEELPGVYHLIKNFIEWLNLPANPSIDLNNFETFKSLWNDYKEITGFENPGDKHFIKNLEGITEDTGTFEKRRNLFLDHLMARFCEQFTDYVLLMNSIEGLRAPGELIEDKIAFLKDYPAISSERGKAFNYRLEGSVWNTDNVSGLEKRLARLTGIDNYFRRSLVCGDIDDYFTIYKDIAGEWRFRFKDNQGNILLRSEGYTLKVNAVKGIESVKLNGAAYENYEELTAVDGRYYFNIIAGSGEIIATSQLYDTKNKRKNVINLLISYFKGECDNEGFHLVEHILLRPANVGDELMPVCVEEDCNSCFGFKDPYSFRASLILPHWTRRFNSMEFRRFFEKTVRLETPAHIHMKICWVTEEDMERFEKAYKAWLIEKSKKIPDEGKLSDKMKTLVKVMNEIKSVYPEATLHDCEESENTNLVLLDNTILGTINNNENGNN